MGKLVSPKVFLVGTTCGNFKGIKEYLEYTKQTDFLDDIEVALKEGLSEGEILCSLMAKLCYKSLVVGKNANISKVRSIQKNIEATYDSGHGSVFEHVSLNFIVTDCSRVFTHELVRHRTGTAFSQTSGRYCRLDSIDLVWDPILDPVKHIFTRCMSEIEKAVYLAECELGLRRPRTDNGGIDPELKGWPVPDQMWVENKEFNFDLKKKLTSAIRRIAPNGQSNEIGFSVNIRALRQTIQLRTAPGAEYEIRNVFAQIYHLIAAKYPTMFYKAKTRIVDEQIQVYGMKLQPWEIEPGDPKALESWSTEQLSMEIFERTSKANRT